MKSSNLKELVTFMAQSLVDDTESVSVNEIDSDQNTVLELKVGPADLGKVIGKQGRTARAMRSILSAASAKLQKRSLLEIVE